MPNWAIDSFGCHWTEGKHCRIWMAARPPYCDRGAWLAHCDPKPSVSPWEFALDGADGWPRYYFDLDRAKAEVEAWLLKRGELSDG